MISLRLPEIISTQHLSLQRLRYEDAEEIFYAYASKPEATQFVSFPTHQSIQDARAFLRYAVPAWHGGQELIYSIRLRQTNSLIGSIGFINEDGKVQFGYILSPTYWGKGLMTEACTATLNVVKVHPGVYRIWTVVDVENQASVKVLLKCGLVEEARLPKWMRFFNQDNQPKDCLLFRLPT
jgi:[ribosomal protein S5]-alanine N-acetyltransferase